MKRPAPPTIQPGKSRPQHTAQNFTAPGSHARDATRAQPHPSGTQCRSTPRPGGAQSEAQCPSNAATCPTNNPARQITAATYSQNFTAPNSHTRDATRTQHIHQEPNADQRHDQEAHRQSQADPNGPEQADQKAHLKYNPTTTHREAPESILSKRGALRARDCRPPLAAPQGRASCG